MAISTLPPTDIRREGTATGCPIARPSRRDLLGAAGFTALAGIAAVTIAKPDADASKAGTTVRDPDAALLGMCTQFLELQAKIDASYAREAEQYRALKRQGAVYEQLNALELAGEVERSPFESGQRVLLDDIGEISAATLPGQQARARVLMAWYSLGKGHEHNSALEWCRLAPLFRDLLGVPV